MGNNTNKCSNFGVKDISSVEECKVAAATLNKTVFKDKVLNVKFSHIWTNALLPKRCHIMYSTIDIPGFGPHGNEIVYWNDHTTGSASGRSSPICKVGRIIKNHDIFECNITLFSHYLVLS